MIDNQPLSFFPSLPPYIGEANYRADSLNKKPPPSDSCRKDSYGHPSLLAGIFTRYCPHGVCYGFQVMETCVSPQHPFQIFRLRFTTAPKVIMMMLANCINIASTENLTSSRKHRSRWTDSTGEDMFAALQDTALTPTRAACTSKAITVKLMSRQTEGCKESKDSWCT